jgi:hypothetical protein
MPETADSERLKVVPDHIVQPFQQTNHWHQEGKKVKSRSKSAGTTAVNA